MFSSFCISGIPLKSPVLCGRYDGESVAAVFRAKVQALHELHISFKDLSSRAES